MRPAIALFKEEKKVMEATLAVFKTGKVKACSDLGAAGIGAAVCESARYGGFGAEVDLSQVPLKVDEITPEEILICESQGRMAVQVEVKDTDEVLTAIRSKGVKTALIGRTNNDDKQVFRYKGRTIAVIPNKPSAATLKELTEK
jgi:phosphoribosylformylglycinamidine synthase